MKYITDCNDCWTNIAQIIEANPSLKDRIGMLIHPHLKVVDGILTARYNELSGANAVNAIHGVTPLEQNDESYHTPSHGWVNCHRDTFALQNGAEFEVNGRYYKYIMP